MNRGDAADPARETEGRLRRLIDSAPFGAHVYELHPDGRLVFVGANESANQILGVDCSQFLGMTIEQAFPPLAETPIPDAYRAVARDGEPYHEEQVLYAEGDIAGVYDVHALQLAPGQVAAFFQDITQRWRAEVERDALEAQLRQAQKMEAVGKLAGGIAHDFNNLLTAISGYAELLRGSFPPDDARVDDVDQIRTASASASALVRQLLAFSRQEVLQPAVMDLGECVRTTERMLRRVLGEDVTLDTRIAPGLDLVLVDETHMVQVVMNLAVNARDAMPTGGILTIEVANADIDQAFADTHPSMVPGRYVCLTVSDVGIGMDEATRLRVFEPFFTTKEPGKGTGLGLATVYGIVKQSGGTVWVESEAGGGSRFSVYLPSHVGVKERRAEPAARTGTGNLTGTILLVEDAADVRAYVTRVLVGNGHRVLAAEDGSTGLEMARQRDGAIDVLLTDVVMPGMSGRELAQRAQALIPGLRIVYMSGYASTILSRETLVAGDVVLLRKPFTPDELEQVIQEALRGSTAG